MREACLPASAVGGDRAGRDDVRRREIDAFAVGCPARHSDFRPGQTRTVLAPRIPTARGLFQVGRYLRKDEPDVMVLRNAAESVGVQAKRLELS
jgi:hypothetical protein